jgi:hypothetical protein
MARLIRRNARHGRSPPRQLVHRREQPGGAEGDKTERDGKQSLPQPAGRFRGYGRRQEEALAIRWLYADRRRAWRGNAFAWRLLVAAAAKRTADRRLSSAEIRRQVFGLGLCHALS